MNLPKYVYNCDDFKPGDQVQYSGPYFDETEIEYAIKALRTGKWLTAGEHVNKFEARFSKKFNVGYSQMVNSGSSANLVMFTALKRHFNWADGDEVIVSPVGFPTTISPIVQNNLVPVFIDIETVTLNFDVNHIEDSITPKTKAIIVSPVLGNPPNMDILKDICERHNILLIGDNCDSLGSKWNVKYITDYYYAWTCSFYPAHHISTGEGGMVCSDDESFVERARSIAWWGRDCYCVGASNALCSGTCGNRFDKWLDGYDGIVDHKYVFTEMGYNLKPLDLQGAIGLAQLEKFDKVEELRRKHFKRIKEIVESNLVFITIPESLPEADPSWFGVPILCDNRYVREDLTKHLESNKIQTRPLFAGNILMHPAYKHLGDYREFPNSNAAFSNVVFLGCPPHYNDAVFDYIEDVFSRFPNKLYDIRG